MKADVAGCSQCCNQERGRRICDNQCSNVRKLPRSVSSSFQYSSHASMTAGSAENFLLGTCVRRRSYSCVSGSMRVSLQADPTAAPLNVSRKSGRGALVAEGELLLGVGRRECVSKGERVGARPMSSQQVQALDGLYDRRPMTLRHPPQ